MVRPPAAWTISESEILERACHHLRLRSRPETDGLLPDPVEPAATAPCADSGP